MPTSSIYPRTFIVCLNTLPFVLLRKGKEKKKKRCYFTVAKQKKEDIYSFLMKKSTSKGTYNLRQRIRAISGSSHKKFTTIEENYCDQYFRVGNANQVPCELCLQENADNTNTINPPEQEIKNQEPLNADQSESPSILQVLNTPSENPATIPRPPAERTDTSSQSSSSDTEESASEESLEENTPLISLPKRPRTLFHNEKEGSSDHLEYDDFIPNCSITSSSEDIPQLSNEMDASKEDISDLQRKMVNLQRQMCKQLEAAQVSLSTPHVTESTIVKPTLFHGRENVDRWLQRFSLYLANGKIPPSSDQAAIKLALHLSGPAETFYYNLPSSVQSSYTLLKDALKERFSPAHRHLRNRQELSKRRQGPTESIEAYLADLNEKFNSLDLRDEDKMCYLIQGLRADIQAEVLKKEPKTYTEAEDKEGSFILSSNQHFKEERKTFPVLFSQPIPIQQNQSRLLKCKVLLPVYSNN